MSSMINKEVNDQIELESSLKNSSSRRKYLIFKLGEEKFGVELSLVKEVIGLTEITSLPEAPSFFKGIINLRGRVISIIDLRKKFGLPNSEYLPKKTSIIITEIEGVMFGVIVDDVDEVASYEIDEQIDNCIDVQGKLSKDYLEGVAKTVDNKLVLLMNIHKILSLDELEIVRKQVA